MQLLLDNLFRNLQLTNHFVSRIAENSDTKSSWNICLFRYKSCCRAEFYYAV